tara:strand:- start:874 stop:2307 length:1434 start_codon:yes stop_codon:yes gene_type:complete
MATNKMKIMVDPIRIKKAESLCKRIQRNAESRNSKFDFEISELKFKDVGRAFSLNPVKAQKKVFMRNHRIQWCDDAKEKIALAIKDNKNTIKAYLTDEHYKNARIIREQYEIKIEHDEFKKSKWEALAIVEPMQDVKNSVPIVNQIPSISKVGLKILKKNWPEKYKGECQHCAKKRKRNDVVMLREKGTNAIKTVGRNCLFEYTEIDPKMIKDLYALSDIQEYKDPEPKYLEDGYGYSNPFGRTVDFQTLTEIACAIFVNYNKYIKGIGYYLNQGIVNKHAGGYWIGLHCPKEGWEPKYKIDLDGKKFGYWIVGLDAKILASVVMKHLELNAEKFKKGSSYERNLIAIYESGFTNAKTFNFGVSAFACYINHVRKMQRKNIDGKFVELTSYPYGTKKKFKDIEVVVTDVRTGTSKYSGKSWMLINAAYDNKYRLQWWGNDSTVAPNIGDKLTITANIKKNDEFRGNAYTELNHVKVN